MINLDFIAVDGDIDVRGGGRLLRNGNELLDEKNGAEKLDLLNQIYPVGSLFICKTGTGSPASKYGGNWQCLAENVVLPLGGDAPVKAGETNSNVAGYSMRFADPSGNRFTGTYNIKLYEGETVAYTDASGGTFGKYASPINLHADLSRATNAIPSVDIWQRIEEI